MRGFARRRFAGRRSPKAEALSVSARVASDALTRHKAQMSQSDEDEAGDAGAWELLAAAAGDAQGLLAVLEAREGYSRKRAQGVVDLAVGVGRRLGMEGARLVDLEWSARLHDIGKLGVSQTILSKPAELTGVEWAEMYRHAEIGERIIVSTLELSHLARVIRAGHERWDGRGIQTGCTVTRSRSPAALSSPAARIRR
jgi:HD-GYP domain-containing protein (c-di-GMP phosphodiesterase class II)